MESKVPKAKEVPRSELDTAFDVSRAWRGMVVPSMSSEAWGYVVRLDNREGIRQDRFQATLVVPSYWRRDSHPGATGEGGG